MLQPFIRLFYRNAIGRIFSPCVRIADNNVRFPPKRYRNACSRYDVLYTHQKEFDWKALFRILCIFWHGHLIWCRKRHKPSSFSFRPFRSRIASWQTVLTIQGYQPSTFSPPYLSSAPHPWQNTSPEATFAPQVLQYLGAFSHGEQSTHSNVSALYMTAETHRPHLWHRLKCFLPSRSHAICRASSSLGARMGPAVQRSIPEASQKNCTVLPFESLMIL